ncbi:hypothetical protein C5C39_04335 [Rathayibacter sp. AY1F3]|uniref:hypothetical protein n=1 Tax=Rathayibacter sp. AY1F3 TaxID=2080558 RepID=UPI000CE8AAD0|nr:hypothetical protein [Rathayibacter sp. AY1F3]PPG92264.1 hypothetical protein C5C39_04335 [Rathayibacter sp. AY1F3]
MTTDDRTARLSTPADEQPTVDLGATAVLTEERPSAGASAAGLVFGILGLRREPTGRTLSIWGIVLNSVMLGLVLLFAIAVLVVVVLVPLAALASGSDYR